VGDQPDVHPAAAAEAGPLPLLDDGHIDEHGNPGPVRRNDGSIIPNQADTVLGTP